MDPIITDVFYYLPIITAVFLTISSISGFALKFNLPLFSDLASLYDVVKSIIGNRRALSPGMTYFLLLRSLRFPAKKITLLLSWLSG